MRNREHRAYCTIWEFIVKDGSNSEFEKCYAADGAWAALFQRGSGYLKTDLIKDQTDPQRYLTIDYWQTREDYSEFRSNFDAAYETLDKYCEHMTVQETKIGEFTKIDQG